MAGEFDQMKKHLKPIWFYREKKLLVMQSSTLTSICGRSCEELNPESEKFLYT